MFLYGVTNRESWFYNNFGVYQKVNQNVYVYVSKMIGFYTVQLYERSTANLCTLEARSEDIEVLFELGDKWLEKYVDFDLTKIEQDKHYIGNPAWRDKSWI